MKQAGKQYAGRWVNFPWSRRSEIYMRMKNMTGTRKQITLKAE